MAEEETKKRIVRGAAGALLWAWWQVKVGEAHPRIGLWDVWVIGGLAVAAYLGEGKKASKNSVQYYS